MYYDILPSTGTYRGIDRWLENPFCYHNHYSSKEQETELLELYYETIDITFHQSTAKKGFLRLLEISNIFVHAGIPSEVVVYDKIELHDAYGRKIERLGIDVTHKMRESLLTEPNDAIKSCLNRNGLCDDISYLQFIIQNSDHGNVTWEPCWVYRVCTDEADLEG